MLRYVFDNAVELKRHVHVRSGAALLFFPDLRPARQTGDTLMLELQLREGGQQLVLRATVHSQVEGAHPGVWLQFSDLFCRTMDADAAALHRRNHPRLGSNLMVEVREQDLSARIARMLDISAGGARLGSASGLGAGGTVELQLLTPLADVPRAIGRARILRSIAGEVGVQFSPEALPRAQLLLDATRRAWKSAVTVTHPQGCCGPGAPVEPPLPRVRSSRPIL